MQFQPDAVVHAGWQGVKGSRAQRAVPVSTALNPIVALADACVAHGVSTFVGLGSQMEYGPKERTDFGRGNCCTSDALWAGQAVFFDSCRGLGARAAGLRFLLGGGIFPLCRAQRQWLVARAKCHKGSKNW